MSTGTRTGLGTFVAPTFRLYRVQLAPVACTVQSDMGPPPWYTVHVPHYDPQKEPMINASRPRSAVPVLCFGTGSGAELPPHAGNASGSTPGRELGPLAGLSSRCVDSRRVGGTAPGNGAASRVTQWEAGCLRGSASLGDSEGRPARLTLAA